MKELFINEVYDIKVGDEVQSFFMAKDFEVRIGGNKKQFLDITLMDKTGEIAAKQWDLTEDHISEYKGIKAGDTVKIRGNISEWNGVKQIKITKLRKSIPNDNLVIMDYVKAAPESAESMYDFVCAKAEEVKDKDYKNICMAILERNKEKLMYYPAAAKNHHAEMSGLLYHIKRMLASGIALCEVYKNLNVDLVVTGVIIHDIEKLKEIDSNELGMASGYSFEGQMLGHLVQGVKLIDNLGREFGVSEEKMIMLEHMMISHHYEPEYGSPRKPLFPEAEILHYLDMMDAKMYDMEEALASTAPGGFSERVWTLENRRVYKPNEQ